MRKLIRVLLALAIVQGIAAAVGHLLSRRIARGDETSDEFQVAAICGGRAFRSHASRLRSGSVITTMGGVDLDLTDATLDDAGAKLELKATMGGIKVVVPEEWAVDVEAENHGGEVETRVTDASELAEDAPRLHVRAMTRMGGVLVKTAV